MEPSCLIKSGFFALCVAMCMFWVVLRLVGAVDLWEIGSAMERLRLGSVHWNVVMPYRGNSSQPHTLCFVRDDYVLTAASNKPLINFWSMQRRVTHFHSFTSLFWSHMTREIKHHLIVMRPTAVHALLADIICQTIVQHCCTSGFELTATCCV